jgi:hypothetical protein
MRADERQDAATEVFGEPVEDRPQMERPTGSIDARALARVGETARAG